MVLTKNKKMIIFMVVVFIFGYIFLYNFFEEGKYNELPKDWYYGSIDAYDCVTVDSIFMEIDGQKGMTTNHISFNSNCKKDFGFSILHPNITHFDFNGDSSLIKRINLTDSGRIEILFNSSSIEINKYYAFDIYTKNIFDFYAYYNIRTPDANPQKIVFIFDSLKYLCGDCINIIEGELDKENGERGIFYREHNRAVKTFFIDGSNSFLFRFNPQNKWVILIQKIIDGLFLGIVATLLYVLLFEQKNLKEANQITSIKVTKKVKQTKRKKQS